MAENRPLGMDHDQFESLCSCQSPDSVEEAQVFLAALEKLAGRVRDFIAGKVWTIHIEYEDYEMSRENEEIPANWNADGTIGEALPANGNGHPDRIA